MKKAIIKIVIFLSISLLNINTVFSEEITVDQEYSISDLADLHCLELNIWHEARGEPKLGKIAVAFVAINRVKSRKFPDTICKVIKQPGQFSWVKGIPNSMKAKVSEEVRQIAFEVMISKTMQDSSKGAIYFHNRNVGRFNRRITAEIGGHIFYR